jgi:hypothetical protein
MRSEGQGPVQGSRVRDQGLGVRVTIVNSLWMNPAMKYTPVTITYVRVRVRG